MSLTSQFLKYQSDYEMICELLLHARQPLLTCDVTLNPRSFGAGGASYRYDGLHLTHRGTSVLVKNIRFKIVSRTPEIQHSRNNETNHLQQDNAVPERKEGVKLEKGESPAQLNTVKHQMPMQQQLPQGPYGHPSIFGLPNFYGHPAYYGQHNPFMQRMFIPFG